MEDRYEIRSRIGQGGFGSVYRAFDKRMNREVAIKRINASNEDGMLEEAARQLSKEAGALASMQHPNIITVYDVGNDEDGPYVVMELLSGHALDELVEKAPLTWDDFRELAMQTQEALIGAQELDLVHRDIKPANVMLAWLPSGKFQVKLLDFGLAKLTQRPSLQTLNQADSIFGSIFFMSPEQFERSPIDRRTDMYAMGCVYYYALTGAHPFDGATAVQVMSAHLHHDFVPLDEVRPDLPKWACDWVMWHMNRYPDDRPDSAREALQVFVHNDKHPPVEAPPASPETQKRPKLLIPGAEPLTPDDVPQRQPQATGQVGVITKTAPQPLVPPSGKPSVHSSRQLEIEEARKPSQAQPQTSATQHEEESPQGTAEAVEQEAPETVEPAAPPETKVEPEPEESKPAEETKPATGPATRQINLIQKKPAIAPPTGGVQVKPQPEPAATPGTGSAPMLIKRPSPTGPQKTVLSPTGSKTGVIKPAVTKTASQQISAPASASAAGTQSADMEAAAAPDLIDAAKPASSNTAKLAVIAVASAMLLLVGWFVLQKMAQNKIAGRYSDLITLAAHPETTSVPMDKTMLDYMLRTSASVGSNTERENVFRALFLATSTDGTDIDLEIVRFATEREMMENVRESLIKRVLRRRENPGIVGPLLDFASTTDKAPAAAAAFEAVRNLVDESHMDSLLGTIQFATNVEVRRAAEAAAGEVITKSSDRQKFASKLHGIFRSSVNDEARHAALRLSGRIGDSTSLELVREVLASRNATDRMAALSALSSWRNEEAFPVLVGFLNSADDDRLFTQAFETGLRYATNLGDSGIDSQIRRDMWNQLSTIARNPEEQIRFIQTIAANDEDEWVVEIIKKFTSSSTDRRVSDVARRAINSINIRRGQ